MLFSSNRLPTTSMIQLQIRGSCDPFIGWINLLEQLTELRETRTFTSLLKDMIKVTDEEIHRMMSGRVPSRGPSVPVVFRYVTFLVHGFVHCPGSSLSPLLWDFVELPHIAWLIINSTFSPSPLSREVGTENPKLPIMDCSFQSSAPIQEPTQSHLPTTKESYHPGNYKGMRSPVSGRESEASCSNKRCS